MHGRFAYPVSAGTRHLFASPADVTSERENYICAPAGKCSGVGLHLGLGLSLPLGKDPHSAQPCRPSTGLLLLNESRVACGSGCWQGRFCCRQKGAGLGGCHAAALLVLWKGRFTVDKHCCGRLTTSIPKDPHPSTRPTAVNRETGLVGECASTPEVRQLQYRKAEWITTSSPKDPKTFANKQAYYRWRASPAFWGKSPSNG